MSNFQNALGGLLRRMSTVTTDSSDGECSPSHTPTSASSLQEMVFTYQGGQSGSSDKSPECQPPASRRRRASMQDALDHTKINARLYEQITTFQQQQSIASIQEENLGSVNLCLTYSPDQALLTVRLIQVRDLCPREINSLLNPYAKLALKPHCQEYLQSKVHKHTLHPEFEEEFIFELTPSELASASLDVHVVNNDGASHDDVLGQVLLPLDNMNLTEPLVLWKGLSRFKKEQEEEDLGEVMFSIGYLSSAGRLTVSVSKAKNLKPPEDSKNTANPFVKVSIMSNGKKLKKKKTSTKRGSLNPEWNEALVYNLGKEDIQGISLEFEVINDNLLGSSEVMGKVMIGKNSRGDELTHWLDVLHSKNALARWHRLKKDLS